MKEEKKKIGILGMGAIGSVVSIAMMSNNVNELQYFSRSRKSKIKLIRKGIQIEKTIDVLTDSLDNYSLDWLIICLKEYHYKYAVNWFSKLIKTTTKVAVIRNGIYLKDSLLDFTTKDNIVECIIDCPTQLLEKGIYWQLSKGKIKIPISDLSRQFKKLFHASEIEVKMVDDYKTESWKKLIESSAIGSILFETDQTCIVFQDIKYLHLYITLLKESVLVAIADGARLNDRFVEFSTKKLKTYPPEKGSSMLTDKLNRRPIEIDAKNGAITKFAKKYKIPTPANNRLVEKMRQYNLDLG